VNRLSDAAKRLTNGRCDADGRIAGLLPHHQFQLVDGVSQPLLLLLLTE